MQETVSKITAGRRADLVVREIAATSPSFRHCGLRGWVLGVKHSVVSVKLKTRVRRIARATNAYCHPTVHLLVLVRDGHHAATRAASTAHPARNDDLRVRHPLRKVLYHGIIARPVAAREAAANLVREGNTLWRRLQLVADGVERVLEPALARLGAVAFRRSRLDAIVLVRRAHLKLAKDANDGRPANARKCRLPHVDGAGRCRPLESQTCRGH